MHIIEGGNACRQKDSMCKGPEVRAQMPLCWRLMAPQDRHTWGLMRVSRVFLVPTPMRGKVPH